MDDRFLRQAGIGHGFDRCYPRIYPVLDVRLARGEYDVEQVKLASRF